MSPTYDDAPQLAEGHDLPEAYVHSPPAEQVWSPQPSIAGTYVSQPSGTYGTEPYANNGAYSTTGTHSDAAKSPAVAGAGGVTGPLTGTEAGGDAAYTAPPESTVPGKKTAGTVCGISLVLLLSIIIGILSAAVIGLAAGTGVATKNYNDAKSQVKALNASLVAAQAESTPTGTTPSATAALPSGTPNFSNITNGCSTDADDVTGNIYTSQFFGKPHFTMYCNKDTINPTMLSVFAADFNGCMDACAAWNYYNTTKGDCVAVSFIPAWGNIAVAVAGGAPGDCYLKPGPQTKANLSTPNIGTECHAAIVLS